MTEHTARTPHSRLVEELATAVTGVPGVAFLRPGLAGRLRTALPRPAGVRMTRPDGEGPWHVEIHVVALRQVRTVDVARGVRDEVGRRLDVLAPAESPPRVTVTVTGLL
ncbi:hypothetical protein [Streptomyces acidiscabies]|uniref:hypothetical protein n=1 Tax=Streptomyces acidiscabies TaxID=42234 RepID=UPI000950DE32|nr:hypothetical protein [Streptomyces acidiscabies]